MATNGNRISFALTALVAMLMAAAACGGLYTGGTLIEFALSAERAVGEFAPWQLLPVPPEPIIRLERAEPYTVYAQGRDGALWGCRWASRLDTDCWFSATSLPLETMPPEHRVCVRDVYVTAVLQRVSAVQSIEYNECEYGLGGELTGVTIFRYLLSDGGEVWQYASDELGVGASAHPRYDRIRKWAVFVHCLVTLLLPLFGMSAIWQHRRAQSSGS